jgi:transcriptional regulator with XRE-family HTH domain
MLIQKLRLQRGWSQQQLADMSGLSVRTIQRLEQGQSASTESLKSVAAVFEIDFSTLNPESNMNPNLNQGVSHEEASVFLHVRNLKRFYLHLIQYVIVISLLTVLNLVQINVLQHFKAFWVQWVALGWGIGLLSHAVTVFEIIPLFGAKWERRQVEKRLRRSL